MLSFIKKLFGMGGAPGMTIGVGTSLLCLIAGHRWTRRKPAWIPLWGCDHCGGEGKVPLRPEGGGPMSVTVCPVCHGSKLDPAKDPPPDFNTARKHRKTRRRREEEPEDDPTEELQPAEDETGWWDSIVDWWEALWHKDAPPAIADGDIEAWKARPYKKVKYYVGTCARCGATQGAWTEPLAHVGILGKLLRWLF